MESNILIVSSQKSNLNILKSTIENLGFMVSISGDDNTIPEISKKPLTIISCNSKTKAEPWIAYVKQGGTLICINTNDHISKEIGLNLFEGVGKDGVLLLKNNGKNNSHKILIKTKFYKYSKIHGKIFGTIKVTSPQYKEYPVIIENFIGKGKILNILFSLEGLINYFHQRTNIILPCKKLKSAEEIVLFGDSEEYFSIPQMDIVFEFLGGFISLELSRLNKPLPLLGHFPFGYKSIVTFSFDDFCASGRPIKNALANLINVLRKDNCAKNKMFSLFKAILQIIKEIYDYKNNYQSDVIRLVGLFKKYESKATAFVLPFFAFIKNRPRFTGYKGFSKKTFEFLKNGGWDVGTHIKPLTLNDYRVCKKKFKNHFNESPIGHRGHQLGWVDWDKDWQQLENLEYVYDSTWTWGGHNKLSWILGTSIPFHPVDKNGSQLSIFEVPVVGWIEDMYNTLEDSIKHIENCLELYPGLFSFAGHSWRTKEKKYVNFIERIITMSKTKADVGVGYTLREICEFIAKREKSKIVEIKWDTKNYDVSFVIESKCDNDELTVFIPNLWNKRKIHSIYINKNIANYGFKKQWKICYSTIKIKSGLSFIRVRYSF